MRTNPTAMTDARDFTPQARPAHIDIDSRPSPSPSQRDVETASIQSRRESITSIRKRRPTRSNTVKTFYQPERGTQWQAGQEPGISPDAHPPHDENIAVPPKLHQKCQITAVDFSREHLQTCELENDTLDEFLDAARPEWATCRWININGLSWDVISSLGKHYKLHRLAIEDMMNTRNRLG